MNKHIRKWGFSIGTGIIFCFANCIQILDAQELFIEGRAYISRMDKDNDAEEVVVRLVDGVLGVRDISTLRDVSVSGKVGIANSMLFASRGLISRASEIKWSFLGSGYCDSESCAQHHMPRNGTLKRLSVKALQKVTAGSSVTVTVRKNGADTALALVLTEVDGTAVKTKLDTISVVEGDLITVKYEETLGVEQENAKYFSSFIEFE